jgi:hypothetical protein
MKNQQDTTSTKKKNRDFFKELDKDRHEKQCEYAVLVSLLEQESELYTGITNVYDYDKMFVIRPQCFLEIINLLRLGNLKAIELKKELIESKKEYADMNQFDENLNSFKEAFGKNFRLASENFDNAISEIDKSIKEMEKVKEYLTKSKNNLRLANDKLEDVSVKKLTKGIKSLEKK